MKKLIRYGCMLLCLFLLLSACDGEKKPENDPVDVGEQAAIALVENDFDAYCDLLLPDMFSGGAVYRHEFDEYMPEFLKYVAYYCEIDLHSAKVYIADKNGTDGFMSWYDYSTADKSSLSNPYDVGNFAGSFIYNYAWDYLSYMEYPGEVEEIAVCGFTMYDKGEPDLCAIILGKVKNQWYVICPLDY